MKTQYNGPTFEVYELEQTEGALGAQLAVLAKDAVAAGRLPAVMLEASWAPPCQKLLGSLDDPRMQQAFAGVRLFVLREHLWGERVGEEQGVRPGFFPTLAPLNEQGVAIDSGLNGGAWGDDVPEEMAPIIRSHFALYLR